MGKVFRRAQHSGALVIVPYVLVYDDFNDNSIDANKWVVGGGGTGTGLEQNARFELAVTSGTDKYVRSNTKYNCHEAETLAEVFNATLTGTSAVVQVLQVSDTSFTTYNMFQILYNGSVTTIQAISTSMTTSHTAVTYNSTNHRWLRIRRQGGTIYFDTSPDNVTWTNLHTSATTLDVKAMYSMFRVANFASGTAAAYVDNFSWNSLWTPTSQWWADDFNDNSINGSYTIYDTGGTITETGGQFKFDLPTSPNGKGRGAYPTTGIAAAGVSSQIQTVSHTSDGNTSLVMSLQDASNTVYYQVVHDAISNLFEAAKYVVGTATFSILNSTTFSSTTHKYWRIRLENDAINWEYSSDGTYWTTFWREATAAGYTADLIAINLHNYGSTSAAQQWIIDNWMIKKHQLQYAVHSPVFGDDFDDNSFDTAKWARLGSVTGYSVTETSNKLTLAGSSSTGVDGIVSQNSYSMYDCNWSWEIPSALSGSGCDMYMIAIDAGSRYFGFVYKTSTSSNITCEYSTGVPSDVTIGFNATTMRWMRLRYSFVNDTMYWETSPDNAYWTIQRTVTSFGQTNGFLMGALKMRMQMNMTASSATVTIDNLYLKDN